MCAPLLVKNSWVPFGIIFPVLTSQKALFFALKKRKLILWKYFEESLWQGCLIYQYAPMCGVSDLYHKLCRWNDHNLLIWLETSICSYMIDLFVKTFFCKCCQKSSLSFFIATSTHIRIPCQRIWFFEVFITLLHFFLKTIKTVATTNHRKRWYFLELSMFLWYNH